jgi:hypothetical protein
VTIAAGDDAVHELAAAFERRFRVGVDGMQANQGDEHHGDPND